MSGFMLTTTDNPFNPFEQFDEWLRYDEGTMNYGTCGYLARVCREWPNMTDEEEEMEIERAIDEICALNPLGIYKKVTRNDYKNGKWHPKRLFFDKKPLEGSAKDPSGG